MSSTTGIPSSRSFCCSLLSTSRPSAPALHQDQESTQASFIRHALFRSAQRLAISGTIYRTWKPASMSTRSGRSLCLCLQLLNSSHQQLDLPALAISSSTQLNVKVHQSCIVKPSVLAAPPSSIRPSHLDLSNLDLVMLPVSVEMVFSYAGDPNRGDVDPAKVMKAALERVLVHSYPLAGRLRPQLGPDQENISRPFVECNDAGVAFADADANIALAELGELTLPDPAILAAFVAQLPAALANDPPLLSVQVTRFKCGGFVLGLAFRHCLLDGSALVNFMTLWAEAARGAPLSALPVLDRTFLKARTTLQVKYTHDEFLCIDDDVNIPSQDDTSDLVLRSFCFTPQAMEKLRSKATEDGRLSSCTAFQALAALIWQARTTALHMNTEQKVKLLIVCDGRLARGAKFPKRYLGNSATFTAAIARAGELAGNPLSFAAKHVRDAVRRVTADYVRSQLDLVERGVPFSPPPATFAISAWAWVPFYDIDFGWGKAIHVLPTNVMNIPQWSIVLARGAGRKGVNVLLCQPAQVMATIEELLQPHLLSDPYVSRREA